MHEEMRATALASLAAAQEDSLPFPQIVGMLIDAGFESYAIDFRRAAAIYYTADGDSVELPTHEVTNAVAPELDRHALQSAIREAQQQVPGYSYRGFCEKAASAGCASYIVSFSGRRAVYIARTGATHVEPFPD
ncbi:DUF1398 domain-containing protein [Sphingobium sp. CR28]|uniref:DUF1398 domain-containing protein n=1 Tax=Sphingobium sp. CR28 TaxID=3400272 RepID=UPI003FF02FD4